MYGELCYARVVSTDDPENRGRVEVLLDEGNAQITLWAMVLSLSSGSGYGVQAFPEIEERVLLAFPQGKGSEPVVLGSLFSGTAQPPESDPSVKLIKTREGHSLKLADTGESEGIELETASGHRISLEDDGDRIELNHSSGASVTISSDTIRIQSNSKIEIEGTTLDLTAASINLDAALVKCSGLIQGDTIQVNSVIATTYTPGTGNIW